ncbi:hypothetical protein BT63DRAFT_159880 [Microthyrium microscopicum]|uniref:DUF1996 domain-containing protein n=1 Tax=Microthyrium microscopicum TaxID=703497 RepID=A0A6A6URK4_9PEZI|nr:hypothetical protein BT63DRAFT_159880 [Microthyrium microscopicum]
MRVLDTICALVPILGAAQAMWRMQCLNFDGIYRIDPLVSPGKLSDHAHTFHGSPGFGMNISHDEIRAGSCTSCLVTHDKSVYWTPPLMFQYPNGTTVVLEQIGGMLAYYEQLPIVPIPQPGQTTAFPAGFRMIAGDNTRRGSTLPATIEQKSVWVFDPKMREQSTLAQLAIGFNCLNYKGTPEPFDDRNKLPGRHVLDSCADGLRLELTFPSCWDGEHLDSPDHKSHVAYSSLVFDGTCPEGFEKRLPTLKYETIFNVAKYNGVEGKFMLSNGDETGYSYHGDYVMGWDEKFLQDAVDGCQNRSGLVGDCQYFKDAIQPENAAASCHFNPPEKAQEENCAGPRLGNCHGPDGHAGSKSCPAKRKRSDNCGSSPVQNGNIPSLAAIKHQSRSTVATQLPAPPTPLAVPPPASSRNPKIKIVIEEVTVEETTTQWIKRAEATELPGAAHHSHAGHVQRHQNLHKRHGHHHG